MTTMNISLPEELKAYVDEQVRVRGYSSNSEFVRDMIRRQKDVSDLREMLMKGMDAPEPETSDAKFFSILRAKAGKGQ